MEEKKTNKLFVLSVRNGTEKNSSNSVTTKTNKEYRPDCPVPLHECCLFALPEIVFIFAYILTVTNSNKLLRQPFTQAPPTMTRFSGTLFTLAGTGMSLHAGNILAMNTYKFTEFGCYEVKIEEKD